MHLKKVFAERQSVFYYSIIGMAVGVISASFEYFARFNTDDPQRFIPLLTRAALMGLMILTSIRIFNVLFEDHFSKKSFLYLVSLKSLFYTFCATFWLALINGVWFMIDDDQPWTNELIDYLSDEMYVINLLSIFLAVIGFVSLGQINSLHRKGELMNFILGRYHQPKEVERIFCFIDLKGSTTIAEKLGNFAFASFLKEYYSDITEALKKTNAEIYQYIGDEIVLSWSYNKGIEDNNIIQCFFKMKEIIQSVKHKYIAKYGVYPEFRAGLHGGKVIVTWVGELKKEIVYVGDVLNTASRIQKDCKRLEKEFLVSDVILDRLPDLKFFKASFVEETVPRGKSESVGLYSLESL